MSNHAPKVDPISWLVFIASALSILLAVYFLISSLINTVKSNSTKGDVDNTMLVAAASDNLKPIGQSLTSDAKPAAPAAARSGKEVFNAVCTACHTAGVAGAPKIDDKAAWEPRVATGIDALMNSAINGKGAMPARGGNPAVTDAELKATIAYMTKQAGFDLDIGAEPAAAAPAKKEEAAPEAKAEEAPAKEEKAAAPAPNTEEKPAATTEAAPEPTTEAPAAQEAMAEPTAPEAPTAPTPEVAAPVAAAAATAVAETASAAPSAADLEKGNAIYSKTCFACHATGVAGSPKLGDKAAWEPRIATGMDALYHTALNGKGAMPAKGGNVALSDEDVKAAVNYMVSEVK